MKLPSWFPHWMNRANILIFCVLLLFGGAIFAKWTADDIEGKDSSLEPGENYQTSMEWWNQKDESGVSRAESLAEYNRITREKIAERKRLKEEAAIEKEALIRAKSAKMLHDMLQGER